MATLVQPLNKILSVVQLINEGKDIDAISSLSLKANDKNYSGSLFDRMLQLSEAIGEGQVHSGALLVSQDAKMDSVKDILSEDMQLGYNLAQDISFIVANSVSEISSLTEMKNSDGKVIIEEANMKNVKDTMTDGLIVMRDALSEVFSSAAKMAKKASEVLSEAFANDKNDYATLMSNAIAGANMLVTISKLNSYAQNNAKLLAESANTDIDILNNSDNVLFNTLDLQESFINTCIGMKRFNEAFTARLSNKEDSAMQDLSEYLATAIERIAMPICEGKIAIKNSEIANAYNRAMLDVAALYDEYLQDYISH